MRALKSALLVLAVAAMSATQSSEPPLGDARLTVHTLVREDIFAGFIGDDLTRLARGERNITALLESRPGERANLVAWRAGAVVAHEAARADEFQRYYQEARDGFAEAARIGSGNDGVAAITGGSYAIFADRLPEKHRAEAWAQAYAAYSQLWKEQEAVIEKLPVHHRGEVLAGLAQSAQRTGRTDEAVQHLDRMLALLAGTQYEALARQWKTEPATAAGSNLTCKTCHAPGRLSARIAALSK
jgi:tetratricopeptide (TPR) repeat protein